MAETTGLHDASPSFGLVGACSPALQSFAILKLKFFAPKGQL
jgi:hypothetical protein